MAGYRDLIAWQKAMDLADAVYDAAERWPAGERFRLTDQVLRAAVSVPSNIAEGNGRGSPADFARHLRIAYGSLCEMETQLYLAQRRRYLGQETLDALIAQTTEVGRLLRGLLESATARASQSIREDDIPYQTTGLNDAS